MAKLIESATLGVLLLNGLSGYTFFCHAGEPITALLDDGRKINGFVDSRTTATHLWVGRSLAGVQLASGFPWDRILNGRTAEHEFDAQQLKEVVQEFRQIELGTGDPTTVAGNHELPTDQTLSVEVIDDRHPAMISPTNLRTMEIQAELAHWDRDAQPDGIRIFVSPRDKLGQIVPVYGHIEFTLLAMEVVRSGQSYSRQNKSVVLCRQSFPVRKQQFLHGTAVFELSFAGDYAAIEANFASKARLLARLSVPGITALEAIDTCVVIVDPYEHPFQHP